jgi:hypothetical protein
MTDDEQPEDSDDAPEEEPEGVPEVADDQKADLSGLDLDGDPLDDEDDSDESDGDEEAETEAESEASGMSDPSTGGDLSRGEWGEMYVSMCAQATNGIIEKHGDGHEVSEDHFRSIDLDEHFNAVLEKYSRSSEMEPEQALVVGTVVAVGGPVALHTDVISDLAGEFDL